MPDFSERKKAKKPESETNPNLWRVPQSQVGYLA